MQHGKVIQEYVMIHVTDMHCMIVFTLRTDALVVYNQLRLTLFSLLLFYIKRVHLRLVVYSFIVIYFVFYFDIKNLIYFCVLCV